MKIAILKQGLLILNFCLFISCNNSSKDKTNVTTGTQDDTAVIKNDTTTNQNSTKEQAVPAASQQDYEYGPTVSVITGTITKESFYGPPGYGEYPKTDKREEFYMLVLDKPVNVIYKGEVTDENDDYTHKGVSKIQLLPADNIDLTNYKEKKVRLTGTFFWGHTGHHHTDVLMDVEKLEAL